MSSALMSSPSFPLKLSITRSLLYYCCCRQKRPNIDLKRFSKIYLLLILHLIITLQWIYSQLKTKYRRKFYKVDFLFQCRSKSRRARQCRFSCGYKFWYAHNEYLPDRTRKVVVSSVKTCWKGEPLRRLHGCVTNTTTSKHLIIYLFPY